MYVSTDIFALHFQLNALYFIFDCCILQAITCITMLNNIGESGHSCLVLDLRGKAFDLLPSIMIIAARIFVNALYQLRKFPLFHCSQVRVILFSRDIWKSSLDIFGYHNWEKWCSCYKIPYNAHHSFPQQIII